MKYIKPVLLIFLCVGSFFYGMASLEYKIFPYNQIIQLKIFFEHTQNQDQETEVLNTFFQRLLVKKIYLNEDIFRGGGIVNAGPYLFLMTNKAKTKIFDTTNYKILESEIPDIPMNFEQLKSSKYYNNLRPEWFRVSGIYVEKIGEESYRIYATHHYYEQEKECVQHNISSIEFSISKGSAKSLSSWTTLFSAKPCIDLDPEFYSNRTPYVGQLGGGKIIEHNDSTLMVTVGDYDRNGLNNTEALSQNPNVPYGKVILVDKNTGSWSAYSIGHRNILGLYENNEGTVWIAENGPRGGDELNILEEGANYGWPEESYGVWYFEDYKISDGEIRGLHNQYKKPVYSWLPSIAPNNLVQIEGEKFNHWKKDLIIGTMRDKSLQRIRLNQDNRVIYVEKIPLGHRVRDLTILQDGSLALITDDGFLIIIDDGGTVFEDMSADYQNKREAMNKYDLFSGESEIDINRPDNRESATSIYNRHCANCHSINNKISIGPYLNNLLGREVGSVEDFTYSTTLMQSDKKWDTELLRSFLVEPELEFPDNQMQKISLSNTEMDSIITFLQRISNR